MTKAQVARRVAKLNGKYRVKTVQGWGCWVWQYKQRGDDGSKRGWHSVCPVEQAQQHFGL